MDLGPYHLSGDGTIEFSVDPADDAQADLIVRFDQVQGRVQSERVPGRATDAGESQLLFTGRGLTAKLHAVDVHPTTTSSAVRAEELLSEVELKLSLGIPSMQVADIAVYTGRGGRLRGRDEFGHPLFEIGPDAAERPSVRLDRLGL